MVKKGSNPLAPENEGHYPKKKAIIHLQAAQRLRPGDPALKEVLYEASEQRGAVQKNLIAKDIKDI